jgi:hypothetical protein
MTDQDDTRYLYGQQGDAYLHHDEDQAIEMAADQLLPGNPTEIVIYCWTVEGPDRDMSGIVDRLIDDLGESLAEEGWDDDMSTTIDGFVKRAQDRRPEIVRILLEAWGDKGWVRADKRVARRTYRVWGNPPQWEATKTELYEHRRPLPAPNKDRTHSSGPIGHQPSSSPAAAHVTAPSSRPDLSISAAVSKG